MSTSTLSNEAAPAMVAFAVYDRLNGRVLRSGTMADETSALMQAGQGEAVYLGHVPPLHYVGLDGGLVAMGPRPSIIHVFDWATHVWVDPRTLDEIRSDKVDEINQAFTDASEALTSGYPIAERQTWAAQQSEALAWGADPATPTPYLDGIAAARGIDPADMRTKTLEAVNVFRLASQWLVGTRQALRDAINSPAATRAQIAVIAWPATPPQE